MSVYLWKGILFVHKYIYQGSPKAIPGITLREFWESLQGIGSGEPLGSDFGTGLTTRTPYFAACTPILGLASGLPSPEGTPRSLPLGPGRNSLEYTLSKTLLLPPPRIAANYMILFSDLENCMILAAMLEVIVLSMTIFKNYCARAQR